MHSSFSHQIAKVTCPKLTEAAGDKKKNVFPDF
jgi:hypothetical protein